ncbi:MAG: PAS domain-containing sensor histidine kinase [Actinobacteria bacterium]|nr:PAS domain-containing sensor histidine kinase [Actinomycetota bacterium]
MPARHDVADGARGLATRYLERVVGVTADAVAVIGPDGVILLWNTGMQELTGFTAEAVVGHAWFMALRLRDAAGRELPVAIGNPIADALRTPRDTTTQRLSLLHVDGTWLDIAMRTATVADEQGTVGVVLVVEELGGLDDEQQARADFIATAAHELRTPMTPLKALLLTMERAADRMTPDRIREFADLMLVSLKRLEALVSDLIDAATVDDPTWAATAQPVDVVEVVTGAIEDLPDEDRERVTTQLPEAASVLATDRAVARIVRGLLDNALRHTDGAVTVTAEVHGGEVTIAVEDEGPGIPPSEHAHIFERFVRLGDVMTRPTQGAGLGLTIVRGFAERYGGRVVVCSDVDRGSTFAVDLPAATTP